MEITQVRVFPVEEDKLKAFVSIIFDDCFVVSDIKIIEGTNGLFISMPSKKRKNGSFRDIAHPLNNETRFRIEQQIIEKYRAVMAEEGTRESAPLRQLEEAVDGLAPERASESRASSIDPALSATDPGSRHRDPRAEDPS